MQKWTRKAAAVIAVICLAFGTAGVAMHKWDEMRQEKAQEELTAQVVGMSEAGTTGETMPEKKVPEVENEIGETNAIKETEYVSAIDFQRWIPRIRTSLPGFRFREHRSIIRWFRGRTMIITCTVT